MKKFWISFFLLLFISGACATSPQRVTMIPNDLSSLKGNWQGSRDITLDRARLIDFTEMEIFNDSVPLKGKIVIAFLEGTDTRRYSFENGIIDPEGNLFIQLTEINKINLSLYKQEKSIILDGYYWHRGNQGRLTLHKK